MNLDSYDFLRVLSNLSFVDEIWLYGSRARGDNRPKSDIDLAIVCPSATDSQWYDVLDAIESGDTLLSVDCVRFDKIKDESFRDNILQDKVVIFKRRVL